MASTLRALRPIYGRNKRPSRSTIEGLVKKFESTGTVSPTRRSPALGISVTSLWRILRIDLGLHPERYA